MYNMQTSMRLGGGRVDGRYNSGFKRPCEERCNENTLQHQRSISKMVQYKHPLQWSDVYVCGFQPKQCRCVYRHCRRWNSSKLQSKFIECKSYGRIHSVIHHNRFKCKFLGFSLHLTRNEVIA